MNHKPSPINGFTLLELMVALMISGLIFSAILLGKDLIQNAKNKEFAVEITSIIVAHNQFEEIYNTKPGDFSRASDVWGADVFNGDGDGITEYFIEDPNNPLSLKYEGFAAWEHLERAQLLTLGELTGETVSTYCAAPIIDFNVPKANFNKKIAYIFDNNRFIATLLREDFNTACHLTIEYYFFREYIDQVFPDIVEIDYIIDDGNITTGLMQVTNQVPENYFSYPPNYTANKSWISINLE